MTAVHIVFTNPSKSSSSYAVLEAFIEGLEKAGISYTLSDLYDMGFNPELDEQHYLREMGIADSPVPLDVLKEQEKVNACRTLVFIFPVWWSDCPAKLKGWFDRVWTLGFAYYLDDEGQRHSRIIPKKALVLALAGATDESLEQTGIADAMCCVFVNDRLRNTGFVDVQMLFFPGLSEKTKAHYLPEYKMEAYKLGLSLD